MKAPFPYFGGKSRIAATVWAWYGQDIARYIEPFFGSGAVALAAPYPIRKRIFNDKNSLLVNAWRAIRDHPDEVLTAASRPVAEVELNGIHAEMRRREADLTERIEADVDYSDPEVAGWWVWGMCASVGTDWGRPTRPQGVPRLTANVGITSTSYTRRDLLALSRWIQGSKILAGDWSRAVSPAALYADSSPTNITAVFCDPPYATTTRSATYGKHDTLADEGSSLYVDLTAWALEHGTDPRVRIAVCGYAGEYPALEEAGWHTVAWEAHGGYAHQGDGQGQINRKSERIYMSPTCNPPPRQLSLFEEVDS